MLTPVRIPGRDTAVIVNRGWVYSADGATIDAQQWREPVTAEGVAYVSWLPTQTAPRGGPAAPGPERQLDHRRASRAERELIAAMVPYPIAPYQLVLLDAAAFDNAGAAYGGAGRGPMGTGEPADRTRPVRIPLPALDEGPHKSYAVQWFAFAAIALIGTVAVARREWSANASDSAL
jgi:surfeit locus 1 family protein